MFVNNGKINIDLSRAAVNQWPIDLTLFMAWQDIYARGVPWILFISFALIVVAHCKAEG